MRALMILAALSFVALYYTMEVDQLLFSDASLWLMEQQTALGIKLWTIPIGLLVLFSGLHARTRSTQRRKEELNQLLRETVARNTQQQNHSSHAASLAINDEWRMDLVNRIRRLGMPMSASLEIDPFKGVPFGLRLERSTPETARRAIEEFALFIDSVPTPPRTFIRLVDIIDPGVPIKNFVRGGLQRYLNCKQLTITSQIDGIDIRFANADPVWEHDHNLNADV